MPAIATLEQFGVRVGRQVEFDVVKVEVEEYLTLKAEIEFAEEYEFVDLVVESMAGFRFVFGGGD